MASVTDWTRRGTGTVEAFAGPEAPRPRARRSDAVTMARVRVPPSVPISFREACWNVGATRWQTIRAVVLPNSISGILTGVILQVSRAAGETAPVMFTGAVFFKAVERGELFPYGLRDQCMALSMHLYTLATQVPNVREALPYATAVVLLGSVLLVNGSAIALRVWLRGRKKW